MVDGSKVFHYFLVLSDGPLIMVRVPMCGNPGKRRHVSPWRTLMIKLTPVMKDHGLRSKDILGVDGVWHPDEFESQPMWRKAIKTDRDIRLEKTHQETLERVEGAYAGDVLAFGSFWLYEWNPESESYNLARKGDGK